MSSTVTDDLAAQVVVTHDPTRDHFIVAGWMFSVWDDLADHQPRVRDTDAAQCLGFARPRDIRRIIKRAWPESQGPVSRPGVRYQSTGNGGRRQFTVNEHWLTENELLHVIAETSTPISSAMVDLMNSAFMAVRRVLRNRHATPSRRAPSAARRAMPSPRWASLEAHAVAQWRDAVLQHALGDEERGGPAVGDELAKLDHALVSALARCGGARTGSGECRALLVLASALARVVANVGERAVATPYEAWLSNESIAIAARGAHLAAMVLNRAQVDGARSRAVAQ